MKVLMTADCVGGVWTYALDLCRGLAAHDVEVLLATMGPKPQSAQRDAAHALSNVQLIESDYDLEWMLDPWEDVNAAGHWLLESASAFDADVIHLNGYAHAVLRWSRPVISVAHSCVASWWQAVHGTEPPQEWNEYRHRVRSGLLRADRVVAPTRAFAEELRRTYQLTRHIDVIHNGRSNHATEGSRNRAPLIFACGRAWDAAKNFAALDLAARDLKWPVFLAGSTQSPDGEIWKPRTLNCVGPLDADEMQEWFANAAIFVHPSLYEPFGLSVVEAALSGCCLVLADLSTLRELWDGAAEFFDPRKPDSLCEAICSVTENVAHRESLVDAARTRASNYSSEAMAAGYAQLYRERVRTARKAHRGTLGAVA